MQRIVKHHELEVYKRAFEAAMQIFELSKRTKSVARHVRFVLISPKRGASGDMKPRLSVS
jgi:isopenicillin N synthase-like dioxygenase